MPIEDRPPTPRRRRPASIKPPPTTTPSGPITHTVANFGGGTFVQLRFTGLDAAQLREIMAALSHLRTDIPDLTSPGMVPHWAPAVHCEGNKFTLYTPKIPARLLTQPKWLAALADVVKERPTSTPPVEYKTIILEDVSVQSLNSLATWTQTRGPGEVLTNQIDNIVVGLRNGLAVTIETRHRREDELDEED